MKAGQAHARSQASRVQVPSPRTWESLPCACRNTCAPTKVGKFAPCTGGQAEHACGRPAHTVELACPVRMEEPTLYAHERANLARAGEPAPCVYGPALRGGTNPTRAGAAPSVYESQPSARL